MRVITAIGEQGLQHPDGTGVVLRPSMYAMTRLGEPEDIVAKFVTLHAPAPLAKSSEGDSIGVIAAINAENKRRMRDHWREMLFLSWEVLNACADDADLVPFIGEPGTRYASYRFGPVPMEVMVELARSLMQHGTIGPIKHIKPADPDAPKNPDKYVPGFDALLFVSKATAVLGMSEAEAWAMTMTSFAAAWEAKFGENKQERHSQEHDDTMAWLAKVNSKRESKAA